MIFVESSYPDFPDNWHQESSIFKTVEAAREYIFNCYNDGERVNFRIVEVNPIIHERYEPDWDSFEEWLTQKRKERKTLNA